MLMMPKLLVITPVKHIGSVQTTLDEKYSTTYLDDPTLDEVVDIIEAYDAVFTNPNKSKVYIGKELIDAANKLKVICTASTGTNHIDKAYARKKGITILSLTEEREVINRISSTAEHALALTMASLRNVINGHHDVLKGEWNYEKFIGRQMDGLTVGVVGYGRLGTFYAKYCKVFGSRVLVFDPYKKVENNNVEQVNKVETLLQESDVISFHVHVTGETTNMVDKDWFRKMKPDVLLVNTSRGEIIVETDLVEFLTQNTNAQIATDVLANEIRNRDESRLLKYAKISNQVIITPHIGGMTKEAQEIAYNHMVNLLIRFLNKERNKV